jgi:pimeloyl-ACP methyl ester carboxylesterase
VADSDLHVSWSGSGEPVLLVHGSFALARDAFAEQAPLADEFRLGLVDRRGFGASPDTARVDFEQDAEDLVRLLDEPAHLVGHSYGGIGCLLAAARRPGAVRSLTVIEPPALALAPDDPAARALQARIEQVFARRVDPATLYADFLEAWGLKRPTAERLALLDARALASSADERLPSEARIPLGKLAAAPFPRLVVSGGWDRARPEARELAGRAFAAVCDALERGIGAERLRIPGETHAAQLAGEAFNEPLRRFLRAAGA